jgi:predicted nucleic acid-binding Zn ribbon protein
MEIILYFRRRAEKMMLKPYLIVALLYVLYWFTALIHRIVRLLNK